MYPVREISLNTDCAHVHFQYRIVQVVFAPPHTCHLRGSGLQCSWPQKLVLLLLLSSDLVSFWDWFLTVIVTGAAITEIQPQFLPSIICFAHLFPSTFAFSWTCKLTSHPQSQGPCKLSKRSSRWKGKILWPGCHWKAIMVYCMVYHYGKIKNLLSSNQSLLKPSLPSLVFTFCLLSS